MITGRDGRLRPRRIAVAPFIAVRLRLRSADGARYAVAVRGRRLSAGGGRPASVLLPGLAPDRRYVVRPLAGARNRVEIVPASEPGP